MLEKKSISWDHEKILLQNEDQRTLDSVPEVICLGPERSDTKWPVEWLWCVHSASKSSQVVRAILTNCCPAFKKATQSLKKVKGTSRHSIIRIVKFSESMHCNIPSLDLDLFWSCSHLMKKAQKYPTSFMASYLKGFEMNEIDKIGCPNTWCNPCITKRRKLPGQSAFAPYISCHLQKKLVAVLKGEFISWCFGSGWHTTHSSNLVSVLTIL